MSQKKIDDLFARLVGVPLEVNPSEIVMGAVRLKQGRGEKHTRWIGTAKIDVVYQGARKHRPWYQVTVVVDKLRHKISVGGSSDWYVKAGTPVDASAIDAIAESAVRFTTTPDEDTPEDIAFVIDSATQGALQESGHYLVRRTP